MDSPLNLPEYRTLATRLHGELCVYSHTDQCGWVIEEGSTFPDPWKENGTSHKRWLEAVAYLGAHNTSRLLRRLGPKDELQKLEQRRAQSVPLTPAESRLLDADS